MNKNENILITGAYGFIGSCLVSFLNQQGFENLILVDEFDGHPEKELNLLRKKYTVRVERENFFEWIEKEKINISFVFHLGARTDTTEFDYAVHQKLNVDYSQNIWNYCTQNNIPLVYASSAATYGSGSFGYNDEDKNLQQLQPLNPYGISKNEFDKWAIAKSEDKNSAPPFWVGLKFFNVYGPNEYHKGRMASVIFHSYNQIKQNAKVQLFKSHHTDFKNGEQLRDFIYVKDVINVCYWMMEVFFAQKNTSAISGIYNLGTGQARSFNDLTKATFEGLSLQPVIEYIDMPEDLRGKYQYFTQATMHKLNAAGYQQAFHTLEEGVSDYVRNYLSKNLFY
jgi:ADP-L-glycero-D-manno-heptose 6-epimerase